MFVKPLLRSLKSKLRWRVSVPTLGMIVIAFTSTANSQSLPLGARALGMAGTYVAVANTAEAVFLNPGGLAQIEGTELNLFYQKPFGLSDVNFGSFAITTPFRFATISTGVVSLGNEIFSEQKFSAALSRNYRKRLFYGIALSYWRTHIKGYGTNGAIAVDFGMVFPVTQELTFGAQFQNLNRAKRANEKLPQTLSAGLSFEAHPDLTLNFELYKDVRFDEEARFGVEYTPFSKLALRAGTANNPDRFSAGFSIFFGKLNIDYAFFTHNDLGLTHQFALTLKLRPRTKKKRRARILKARAEPQKPARLNDQLGILIRININTATADELTELPGIGKQSAQKIVAYRNKNGAFESIDDLSNIPGIGASTIEKIEKLITVGEEENNEND